MQSLAALLLLSVVVRDLITGGKLSITLRSSDDAARLARSLSQP